jgi:hypothetical protein
LTDMDRIPHTPVTWRLHEMPRARPCNPACERYDGKGQLHCRACRRAPLS